jgi:hypothetical protein
MFESVQKSTAWRFARSAPANNIILCGFFMEDPQMTTATDFVFFDT